MSPALRQIAGLALPALVVLAAEPLYVLVDTAVVGHLGSTALAALAVGGTILTLVTWLGTILAYGTTGRAARQFGAGNRQAAIHEGVQASWLALLAGLLVAGGGQLLAGPIARVLAGGEGDVTSQAELWLRIAALGAPGLMLSVAGNGWLRGIQDTKRPLSYVVVSFALSAILCPLLVYPLGLGLPGSAIANVIAQSLAGVLFVRALVRERMSLRPDVPLMFEQLSVGRDLLLRGIAFQACFLSATAVAARFGTSTLAAHQVALQLWFFTALILDAVAIAAQSLIGAELGAGNAERARQLARQITLIGAASGLMFALLIAVGAAWVPGWFSSDPEVHRQAMIAWPWFVLTQPLAGIVFALDGVLIGAGDVRYMRNLTWVATLGGFFPAIWIAYLLDWGIGGIWAGLMLFIVIRLIALLARLKSGRWAVTGARLSAQAT
ncbi:MATE family efflux transporter [Catelliglobosispora koreensis]|uniref:MATE family efflux transporter n=1 Tax=Catelliglobosispora koreensis TaxID=129052 RepID=UPI0003803D2E|nr:MATE family efflux transporter [Catelliglobosispora koreensis]